MDDARRLSRRLASTEAWLETIPDPAYDPEWHMFDDSPAQTTRASLCSRTLSPASRPFSYGSTGQETWRASARSTGLGDGNPFSSPEDEEAALSVHEAAEPPFHVFTKRQKWLVIATIGAAGLFSGLSSNIYFPALDTIARDLHVSLNDVSLTITSYLLVQAISPLFWGSLSDTLGRRSIYIYSFSIYILANIVLSFSPNFTVLLVFRGLQAAGSASTVSIGNGVIQDITLPVERGAYISFYQAIRNFSIAIGPVLGGILDSFFGFRSIFIFLLIASALVLLVIIVFLPETLRSIAGNGSLKLSGIHQPLPRPKVTFGTFWRPLKLLARKDVLVSLLFGGVVYAVWSMVVASTTGLFKERFRLSELLLGLAFLPNGAGTIIGSTIAGKLMTRGFLSAERTYLLEKPEASPPSGNKKNLPLDFPIEQARLLHVPWITAVFAVAVAGYGFTVLPPDQLPVVARRGWIAVPLLLQFVIAAASNAIFAINTTLVADLCPGQGASATAINNLVRCSLGALGVAFIDVMLAAFGSAATFLGLGLITVGMGLPLAMEWSWGMRWRGLRSGSS